MYSEIIKEIIKCIVLIMLGILFVALILSVVVIVLGEGLDWLLYLITGVVIGINYIREERKERDGKNDK